jgi:molecular chaperone GrpE (heat shock protein)
VLHVERTGYRRGDRVLRAARVAVAGEPGGDD